MSRWRKSIPEGTRDILFEECAIKINIEEKLRNLYRKKGFNEVITPTIEFYDVFSVDNIGIDQEKMYKLFDNTGRILVLRPDITIPVARVAATKLKDSYYPLRLFYSQKIFRANEDLNGKRNEFTQAGVEILGVDNLNADVEVIVTAIKTLLELGINEFTVELGQVQFFKGIVENTNLKDEEIEKVRLFIENKNFTALKDYLESNTSLDENTVEALNALPRLFGDISVISKARTLTNSGRALEALNNIESIYRVLENMGLSQYFSVDLGMVHQINYYTGAIFRAYIDGIGNDVLYGGRYDSLVENFGKAVPATGFGLNIDSIVENMKKQESDKIKLSADYLIYFDTLFIGKAYALAEEYREKGYICELSLQNSKEESLAYAEKKGIKKVIIVESEDIKFCEV